jgi:hypothetical protein
MFELDSQEHYGVGYVLSVVKALTTGSGGADGPPSPAFATDVRRIVDIVKRHVPNATVSTDVGQELQMRLPLISAPAFPALFEELEVRGTNHTAYCRKQLGMSLNIGAANVLPPHASPLV